MVDKGIVKAIQEALALWRVYLATRQEAYERKMDRNMRMAMKYAATCFRRLNEIDVKPDDKVFLKSKQRFYKYRGKT